MALYIDCATAPLLSQLQVFRFRISECPYLRKLGVPMVSGPESFSKVPWLRNQIHFALPKVVCEVSCWLMDRFHLHWHTFDEMCCLL